MKSFLKYSSMLAACFFLIISACEDLDLDNNEAGNVQGFWELYQTRGDNTYLLISDTEVVFYIYDASENCITVDAYEVVRIDGTGFYILTQEGMEENRVLAISRNGESIHVRDIEQTQRELEKYESSNIDINALAPVCVDPTDVFGNWELEVQDGDHIYLSIREDSIKVFDQVQQENCFFLSEIEVLKIDGNVFTITDNDPSSSTGTQEVILIRTNQGLEIERSEDGKIVKELYVESEADFSGFSPICTFDVFQRFEGTWQYNSGLEESGIEFYLTLGQDIFSFHFLIGDPVNDPNTVCFDIQRFEIVSADDNTITIRDTVEPFDEIEIFIEFREEEGLLYLNDTIDILTFFPTDIDQAYINNQCPIPIVPANKIF